MTATPQTPHRQMRMDSPMSDYFTDPSNSPDILIRSPSSIQQEILRRLQSLGDWVLRQELSSHTATKAHVVLDELQGVLVAPDPQSRQPADIEESDLFSPEDEASQQDDIINRCEATEFHNKRLLEESQEDLMRVSAATQKLQMRYQEVKDSNAIAQEAIEQSTREIMRLRSDDERVRSDMSFDHSNMLHLKSRLDTLEANATSLINSVTYHAHYQDLIGGIEKWKVDWDDVYDTLNHRALQRNRATQKKSIPCNALGDDDYRLSTKSDLEPSIECDTGVQGIYPFRSPVDNRVEEGVQAQCRKARGNNTLAKDDNDNESTSTGYSEDDSPAFNDKGGNQQSEMIAAGNTASPLTLGVQTHNLGQKAKPGNWAKLWDQLAELAGIYDH